MVIRDFFVFGRISIWDENGKCAEDDFFIGATQIIIFHLDTDQCHYVQ